MIVIIGSSRDDVLYFQSALRNKTKETLLLKRFPMVMGDIFNQNVMVVSGVYTSLSSTMVSTYILEKYSPFMFINVGRCKTFNKEFKENQIVMSSSSASLDVDQREYENVLLGQVPSFDQVINASIDILMSFEKSFNLLNINSFQICSFFSSDRLYAKKEQLEPFLAGGSIIGLGKKAVLDSETFGMFLACQSHNIPCVSIKVVTGEVGQENSIEDYVSLLGVYCSVGKVVDSFIGEIGRKDVTE